MDSQYEILLDERPRGVSTGSKRNALIEKAIGKYIVFIDDDDIISADYMYNIMMASAYNPDVITFNGIMTTDGANETPFEIRLNHPYINDPRNGKDYYLRLSLIHI